MPPESNHLKAIAVMLRLSVRFPYPKPEATRLPVCAGVWVENLVVKPGMSQIDSSAGTSSPGSTTE
jgi:hypothetical protein